MKTGAAIAIARPRSLAQARGGEMRDFSVDEGAMLGARKRLRGLQQGVAGAPVRHRPRRLAFARPELGEIEMGHDRMFRDRLAAHGAQGRLHARGLPRRARLVAFESGDQHAPPGGQRRQRGEERSARLERLQRLARLPGTAQQQQAPARVAGCQLLIGADVGGRLDAAEQRERLGGALLLQEVGGEIETRAEVRRPALELASQQRLGRLRAAADAQERGQIGRGGGMIGREGEHPRRGRLGVLDRALPIAREPVVDPGVGPARGEPYRLGEGALGARGLSERGPGLAIGVMGGRQRRRVVAGLARRDQRGLGVARRQALDRPGQRRRQGGGGGLRKGPSRGARRAFAQSNLREIAASPINWTKTYNRRSWKFNAGPATGLVGTFRGPPPAGGPGPTRIDLGRRREADMARDRGLEELVREHLGRRAGLSEKAMFGGWAWLIHDNLVCGAREDGMLARLGKGNDGWALERADVGPMILRGRHMQGWVRAGPLAFGDDELRGRLIEAALAFASALPAK